MGPRSLGSGPDGRRGTHRWASLVRRAHAVTYAGAPPPAGIRGLVAGSWRRSYAAGVDPDRPASRILDDSDVEAALRAHPLGGALKSLDNELYALTHGVPQVAAMADADGTLLWVDDHPQALRSATAPRFLPGYSCAELTTGTNAIGTAIAVGEAVQIVSAEHWARPLHGWTCAAAPVRDPRSGRIVGAIDLSGPWQATSPQSLVVARLLARAAEAAIGAALTADHERLRRRYTARYGRPLLAGEALVDGRGEVVLSGTSRWSGRRARLDASGAPVAIEGGPRVEHERFSDGFLVSANGATRNAAMPVIDLRYDGGARVTAVVDGVGRGLSPRVSELLVLLAMHPTGLEDAALRAALYPGPVAAVTLRADVSRLRRAIGPVVSARPFRLHARVTCAEQFVDLLPDSGAPGLQGR